MLSASSCPSTGLSKHANSRSGMAVSVTSSYQNLNAPDDLHPFLDHEIGLTPVHLKVDLFVFPLQLAINHVLRQTAGVLGEGERNPVAQSRIDGIRLEAGPQGALERKSEFLKLEQEVALHDGRNVMLGLVLGDRGNS